ERKASLQGRYWNLKDVSMEPKPIQRSHLTLWFGGHHENALKRAVTYGNGWMGAGSSSSNAFIHESAMIHQFLADTKRDPATFSYGKRVYLAIDGNKERGDKRIRDWFERGYKNDALRRGRS